MKLKVIILSAAMMSGTILPVCANGNAVLSYSSINRVAVPEPLDVSAIRIGSESVKITHEDGYNCFDVTYHLINRTNKDFPDLHYGFPIDYLVADAQETFMVNDDFWMGIYETGWNENLIKDVSFSLDGRPLPFHVSKESVREAVMRASCPDCLDCPECDSIFEDGINRRWFYTEFSVGPNVEVTLNVCYKVYASGRHKNREVSCFQYDYMRERDYYETGYYDTTFFERYLTDGYDIIYDFSPARHFGNNGRFRLDVDIELPQRDNMTVKCGEYTYLTNRIYRHSWGTADSFDPINMKVRYDADYSREKIERLVSQFSLPADSYEATYTDNQVMLDFRVAGFVSEIACDIDTASVSSFRADIAYKDGRTEHSTYTWQDVTRHGMVPISPALLVVTDVADRFTKIKLDTPDEYGCFYKYVDSDFDSDRFKVTNITFTFPEGVSARSAMKNVRAIDSRFGK